MDLGSHIIDKICCCKHCQMIDVMFGDPLLNKWEKEFLESVARQGWQRDYSPKQKAVIEKTYAKQRRKWVA